MKPLVKISLAMLSGLLIAAAWPTSGFAPLAFVAFIPLLYLQDKSSEGKNTRKSRIFLLSLLSFVTWNTLTTWWVWKTTAAGTIAMILLNSVMMATVFWAYHIVKTKLYDNKKGYYVLVVFVLAFEFMHLNWQLNWPWLNLGNVFSHYYTWVQWYEWTGSAGGTVWVLAVNILIYKLIREGARCYKRPRRLVPAVLAIVLPVAVSLVMYHGYEEKGEDVEIAIIQPNLDPYSEEFELTPPEIMERNLSNARKVVTENTRFVVSPESAIQENIWLPNAGQFYSIKELRKFLEDYPKTCYVIGISGYGPVPKGEEDDFAARKFGGSNEYFYAYNTAALIDSTKIQYHQKTRLTPGVESMPSWWFLRPLADMAIDLGGTTGTLKGESEPALLSYDNHKVAVMICYESAFGGFVTRFVKKGADLIFVITNDGWWGDTQGHKQHLEFSSLRAIETRRSIAMSANTGISAYFNQRGDITKRTLYWEQTAMNSTIKTNDKLTFYVRYGDYIYKVSVFITILLLAMTFVKRIIKR